MTPHNDVVFLFDVDNTLLDNDRVQDDLRSHVEREFGTESRDRYWAIFEALRVELGYADYLGALQRYRLEDLCDPRLLMMSSFLVDYPFAKRLYPGSLAALEHVRSWGVPVILSDGDEFPRLGWCGRNCHEDYEYTNCAKDHLCPIHFSSSVAK